MSLSFNQPFISYIIVNLLTNQLIICTKLVIFLCILKVADKIAADRIIRSFVDFDALQVMLSNYVIWFFLTCYEVVAVLGTRFHFASNKTPVLTHNRHSWTQFN